MPSGVDVLAEPLDAVHVAQHESALEDELVREMSGKVTGQRQEGKVLRSDLSGASVVLEQLIETVRMTPEPLGWGHRLHPFSAHPFTPWSSVLAFTRTFH